MLLALGIAGGLLPDPTALAILLASVSSGRLMLGLATVLVFSIGFASALVLVGLVGCLTAGVAAVAQYRGIQLRSVTATIDGQMNVLGILGADPDIRNGFEAVTVRFDIDADASREDLEALIAQSQKRSAVFDALTNPTNVTVEVA